LISCFIQTFQFIWKNILNDLFISLKANLVRVVYKDGDKYANACNKGERSSVIYFMCDPNAVYNIFKKWHKKHKSMMIIFLQFQEK
jgi:hypothetical protein